MSFRDSWLEHHLQFTKDELGDDPVSDSEGEPEFSDTFMTEQVSLDYRPYLPASFQQSKAGPRLGGDSALPNAACII